MADYSDLVSVMSGSRRSSPYDRKRQMALQMLQSGADYSPIQHPLQGAARLAQALVGGWMANKADTEEKEAETKRNETLSAELAKLDPKGNLNGIAKIDPSLALKIAGQGLIENQKMETQRGALATAADGFGSSYGLPPRGSQIQQAPLPTPGGYQGTLGGFESGNNPRAVNPQSGAGGEFQFLPQTWAEVRAKHPDLQLPETPMQATSPQQAAAEARFRDSNAQVLQGAGIPPTPANLYLAHRTGAQGAQTLLKTDPNAPMASVVPQSWIAQNPDMQGKTVGQFVQMAQQRFPGGQPTQQAANVQATPPGQPQPLTVNMRGPGGIPQGSADGAPPPPQAPGGMPAVMAQAPAIPDVPRPQPTPQQIRRAQDLILSGTPRAQAEATMNAEIDRDWSVQRERAKMEYERQFGEYKSGRERADKQPQQQFDNSNKLRDEFNASPAVKSYRTVVPMLESAKDATTRPTRAADLNLVYAFAKLMDPDSVVRESETGAVVATQSVMDRIGSYVGQLNGQAMLNPDARAKLIAELESRFKSLESSYKTLEDHYGGMAARFGVRREDVIVPIRKPAGGTTATSPEDLKKLYGLE